jgi:hypothetical protein
MKDEGWTYGDLAGELMVRGIDIDEVDYESFTRACEYPTPEKAARYIEEAVDAE